MTDTYIIGYSVQIIKLQGECTRMLSDFLDRIRHPLGPDSGLGLFPKSDFSDKISIQDVTVGLTLPCDSYFNEFHSPENPV